MLYGVERHFQQYFSYIVAVSFIVKFYPEKTTDRQTITCCIEYVSPWTGFELTTLVAIGIDCTGKLVVK